MKKILVNLTCINQPPLYSEHNLIPMRFGLDRFHCINVCKSFLIYRTICNAFKLTMSTCNWKKGTLRHWLRPTERCRTNNVLLWMCCLPTAKSERDHLLASIKSEYHLINDIVSKYEHSMRDDHMTNTTKYIGDFMVVAGVLFASCMGNIFRDQSGVSCGAGTWLSFRSIWLHPRFMVGFVLLDL